MKIILATDHAGFEMKEEIKKFLNELGHEVLDCGAEEYNADDDYPDFIAKATNALIDNREEDMEARGIIFGGSGQGEAMCANRFLGIRAVVYYGGPDEIITLSREHNDANMLSLGARFLSVDEAKDAVKLWLGTKFSGEPRHRIRIEKLD